MAETYKVSFGSNGEVLVTAPSGRVEFMGLWAFIRFMVAARLQGKNFDVAC